MVGICLDVGGEVVMITPSVVVVPLLVVMVMVSVSIVVGGCGV